FRSFAAIVPADGLILANGADVNVARALEGQRARIQRVGIESEASQLAAPLAGRSPSDWSVTPTGIENGCHRGDVRHDGKIVAQLKLSVPGLHNLYNATMAV